MLFSTHVVPVLVPFGGTTYLLGQEWEPTISEGGGGAISTNKDVKFYCLCIWAWTSRLTLKSQKDATKRFKNQLFKFCIKHFDTLAFELELYERFQKLSVEGQRHIRNKSFFSSFPAFCGFVSIVPADWKWTATVSFSHCFRRLCCID